MLGGIYSSLLKIQQEHLHPNSEMVHAGPQSKIDRGVHVLKQKQISLIEFKCIMYYILGLKNVLLRIRYFSSALSFPASSMLCSWNFKEKKYNLRKQNGFFLKAFLDHFQDRLLSIFQQILLRKWLIDWLIDWSIGWLIDWWQVLHIVRQNIGRAYDRLASWNDILNEIIAKNTFGHMCGHMYIASERIELESSSWSGFEANLKSFKI